MPESEAGHGKRIAPAALEILAAAAYFCALTICVISWEPGRLGWGFLIHGLSATAFAAALFSGALDKKKPRRPFRAVDAALFFILVWAVFNAVWSRVPFDALERLPFVIDGALLFYAGTTLFARRREGFLLLYVLWIAGMIFLSLQTGLEEIAGAPAPPEAFYRGRRLLKAVISENFFTGAGSGVLPRLHFRYLELPLRRPPAFRGSFGIFFAESGLAGTLVWLLFFATASAGAVFGKKRGLEGDGRRRVLFFLAGGLLAALLLAGLFTPFLAAPHGLLLILPLTGLFWGIARRPGDDEERSEGRRPGALFAAAVLIPLLIFVAWNAAPWMARRLVRNARFEELGSVQYRKRLRLARAISPLDPEPQLAWARHIRALPRSDPRSNPLIIESAYIRALARDPFSEKIHMQYAHFLNLAGEESELALFLEKARDRCPGSAELRLFLFRAYMKNGRRRDAIDALDSLRAFYPLDPAAHYRVSLYYAEAGLQGASRESFALAAQLQPLFNEPPRPRTTATASGEGDFWIEDID